VLLAGLEEDAVAGADLLDRPAAPPAPPDSLEHEDRLSVRMVCQWVRAPGVKWTLLALTRDVSDSAATGSM